MQVAGRVGQHPVGILRHQGFTQTLGHFHCLLQGFTEGQRPLLAPIGGGGFQVHLHFLHQQLQAVALILPDLTTQQVQRLDAVGAFVNRVQAIIPPALLHRVFPGVTGTAIDLDCQVVGLRAEFGWPGLDDWR